MVIDNSKAIEEALGVLGGSATIASEIPEVDTIPTDINVLNTEVLGCGGIPRGRIVELYAKPSVGKSTLAYWLMGQVQKRGGVSALFDAEGCYLRDYGEACGINNNELILPDFLCTNGIAFFRPHFRCSKQQ